MILADSSLLLLVLRWGNVILRGEMPTRFLPFAILSASGLDVGLIIFPLGSFRFMQQKGVWLHNPLAIEFGFWGFFIWLFYFVTTFYFAWLNRACSCSKSLG